MASSSSARQVSSWIYEKKVFVCAPTFDVGCLAQVRVCHDRKLGQGYVSINMRLSLADMDQNQVIKLRICPEMVHMCSVKTTCDDSIPDQVVSMLRGVKEASEVSAFKLHLNTPGIVLIPSSLSTIRPAKVGDVNYNAFSRICQTKTINLYFDKRQFLKDDIICLRAFASALRTHSLHAQPVNHTRSNAGQGVRESDWTVFKQSLSDPPPYRQLSPSANSVLGKRSRGQGSPSPSAMLPLQRTPATCALPPWSPTTVANTPTEVNTPEQHDAFYNGTTFARASTLSTCSPTPVRPTVFTHEKAEEQDRLTVLHVQKLLDNFPDDIVREILRQPRYQRLSQEAALGSPAASSSPTTLAAIENIVENRLDRYVAERLDGLTRSAFKSLTQRHLHSIVGAQLPLAADLILNGAIESYRDQFYEDCKVNEASLLEIVDDGRVRLREAVDECEMEVKESIEEQISRLEDQSAKVDGEVKGQLAELVYWSGTLASEVPKTKGNTSQEVRSRSV
jgi:hypothetical protein